MHENQQSVKQYLQVPHSCIYLLNSVCKYEILASSLICMPRRKHAEKPIPNYSRDHIPQVLYLSKKANIDKNLNNEILCGYALALIETKTN